MNWKTCSVFLYGKRRVGWQSESELGECFWGKFNKIQFHSIHGIENLGIQLGFVLNGFNSILLFVGNRFQAFLKGLRLFWYLDILIHYWIGELRISVTV